MTLFNLSLKPYLDADSLFFRPYKGVFYDEKKEAIILPSQSSISLDTYFNLFSCKYFEYLKIDSLNVKINFKGKIALDIRFKTNSKDISLKKEIFSNENKETIISSIDYQKIEKEGFIYIIITSIEESELFCGSFEVENSNLNKVKIGIVICTYKREEYLKKNILSLTKYIEKNEEFLKKIGVYVIDNGKTLSKDDLPEYINLIPNENTGGAGGFTRGLIEVMKNKDYTHFLFMDDDISFTPEIINKTFSLLSLLKTEYKEASVSGSMLILDRPNIQHELGGKWNGSYNISNGKERDLSTIEDLLKNEENVKVDYGAWWYMCMPIENAKKYGLPLDRLFIKCDDIEYGLRASKEIILINGIGVWHESFDHKYSPVFEYFVKRNELITHSRFPKKKGFFSVWIKLIKSISRALVEQRYFMIDIITEAYLDFLKGSKYYFSIDLLEKIKKLSIKCPKQIYVEDNMIGSFNNSLAESKRETNKGLIQILTLNSYLIPKFLYKNKTKIVSMVSPKPTNFYKTKKIIHYNPYTRYYFETSIKKYMLFYGLWSIIKVTFFMIFKYALAKKSFININKK